MIKSQTAIQQGDPFGPTQFSPEVDDITKSVDAEFNIWFLDDCVNGDSPERVNENVRAVVQKLRLAGLELNLPYLDTKQRQRLPAQLIYFKKSFLI